MQLIFARNEAREARGREFVPERWKDASIPGTGGMTFSKYFQLDEDARPAPTGPTYKFAPDEYPSQTDVWADGKLRSFKWEDEPDGSRRIDKEMDYVSACECVDLKSIPGVDDSMLAAAVQVLRIAAHDSATAYHYESMEGDYELFDAFEADWTATQVEPGRYWTRTGLAILANALRRRTEEEEGLEEIDADMFSEASELCRIIGVTWEELPEPTMYDFYC